MTSSDSSRPKGPLRNGNPRGPKFGPDWPGRRCLAQLRGKPGRFCQLPALSGRDRCKLHGGLSTGPGGYRDDPSLQGWEDASDSTRAQWLAERKAATDHMMMLLARVRAFIRM